MTEGICPLPFLSNVIIFTSNDFKNDSISIIWNAITQNWTDLKRKFNFYREVHLLIV